MTEDTDYTWMQNDINILRHILKKKNIYETYVEVLIQKVLNNFEESSLPEITVPLVRNSLIYDLGRRDSEEIANQFGEMRRTGSYETEIERWAKERGYDK